MKYAVLYISALNRYILNIIIIMYKEHISRDVSRETSLFKFFLKNFSTRFCKVINFKTLYFVKMNYNVSRETL